MNPNKVAMAGPNNLCISYTDSKKSHWIDYDLIEKSITKSKFFIKENDNVNLNPHQVKLYRLAMYGVDALNEEEKNNLNFKESLKIIKNKEYTQKMINRWKQELIVKSVDDLFLSLFPKSKFIKNITNLNDYSDTIINETSFKELGINRKQLLNKLIEWKSLPLNFYQLK
jgi:hypothetical protein